MPRRFTAEQVAAMKAAEAPKKRYSAEEVEAMKAAEKAGPATAAANKFGQGFGFNLADELGGVLEAGGSLVGLRGLSGSPLDIRRETDDEDAESLGDVYRKGRDAVRLRQKATSEVYPKLSDAAEITGGLASGLASANPTSLAGKIGVAGAESALQGFGSSEADNAADTLRDTAVAGAFGAGTTGALGAAGKIAEKTGLADLGRRAIVEPLEQGYDYLTRTLPENLTGFANERAVKAVYGQNKPLLKKLEKSGRIQQTGADLLASDEAGAPVVRRFTNSETAIDRARDKKRFFGEGIGEVGGIVDEITPGGDVRGADVADYVRDWAAKNIPEGPTFDGQRSKLEEFADFYAGKEAMPWDEAQKLKNALKFNVNDPYTKDIGKEATNALNRGVSDSMDQAVGRAVEPATEEQAAKLKLYDYLKGKYQSFRASEQAARDRATGNLSNRYVSPSDMFVGGIAGASSFASDPDKAAPSLALAGGAAMLNKFARTRGSAFAARSAKDIADFLSSNADIAQKYGAPVMKALQEKGPQSAGLTLYLLLKNDPGYRDQLLSSEPTP